MTRILYARDEAGNEHRVIQRLEAAPEGESQDDRGGVRLVYTLEDCSPVRGVDSDTFQVVSTGGYISAVTD